MRRRTRTLVLCLAAIGWLVVACGTQPTPQASRWDVARWDTGTWSP